MQAKVIDYGYGFRLVPIPFESEEERLQHQIERQIKERRLCVKYGIDYDEVLRKRREKDLLKGVGIIP